MDKTEKSSMDGKGAPVSPPQPHTHKGGHKKRKTHKKQRSGGGARQEQSVRHAGDEQENSGGEEQMRELRLRRVKELLQSEKAHVAALDIVVDEYLYPLIRADILPHSTLKEVFCNLELIRNWNQTFLSALEAHLECGDTFGDLFMEMIPFMRQLYTQYNENYDHAMMTYDSTRKNKAVATFLERRQKEMGDSKDLLTYLYLPVQRMLAYDSLLKDILRLTPPGHEDYQHLSDSLQTLRDIEYSATKRAEQRKNINKVIEIQNQLSDDTQLALPHRRYVYEGECDIVHGRNSKERYCFLFNDLILCCKNKKKGKALEIDFKEPLETITVEDLPDDDGLASSTRQSRCCRCSGTDGGADFRRMFKLTSSANEYILTSPQKHNWIVLLQTCKKNLRSEKEKMGLHNELEESSRESLINKIREWSRIEDPEQLQGQVRELAAVLEKYIYMNDPQKTSDLG